MYRALKEENERFQRELKEAQEVRLAALRKDLTSGNAGRNHILWIRYFKLDRNGKPVNIRRIGKDIPSLFFKMCSGVTKRGATECTLNVKEGFTYYQLGVFLARHDSLFRKYMPDFDIRSLREMKDGVGKKDGRFYKETRTIQDLEVHTTEFSQEGDMTDSAETTFPDTVPDTTNPNMPNMFEHNSMTSNTPGANWTTNSQPNAFGFNMTANPQTNAFGANLTINPQTNAFGANLTTNSQTNPFTGHRDLASMPNTNFGVQNGADGKPVVNDKMGFV